MSFEIKWLGTACFEIRIESEKSIVIDPYIDDSVSVPFTSDRIEGCDYIFITHGHYDHVLDAGKLANKFNPEIFCSREVAGALIEHQGIEPDRFTHIASGDVVERGGMRAEIVQGVHVDFVATYQRITGGDLFQDAGGDLKKGIQMAIEASMGPGVSPPDQMQEWMLKYPQGEQLNFVFEINGGKRIYMAGSYPDTSLLEVAKNTRAYMTLLQVLAGNTLKGLEEQTVEFGLASGAEIIVPQHHDPLMKGAQAADLAKVRELFKKHNALFEELEPGNWYKF
ncbi:MAG: MBL fold metallo-hydrolase [Candidatus Lindowbacteria bacterium]|nr:MBL fold metallo-hydrolase [Candidatus Lindowbacteria bacterium]